MAVQDDWRKRHIILGGITETDRFRSARRGGESSAIPDRDRNQHGNALLDQIDALRPHENAVHEAQRTADLGENLKISIKFESFPGVELALDSLGRESSGIELLNVRHDGEVTIATVSVPEGKLDIFENLIRAYLDKDKGKGGRPKNQRLLNAISSIRVATLEALWADDGGAWPDSDEEVFWWEVWLPAGNDRRLIKENFQKIAMRDGFRVAPGELQFPERTVVLVRGSAEEMKKSILMLNSVAGLRRAKETAEFFDSLRPNEQSDWLYDLIERITTPVEGADVPYVCVLDTGVNSRHPLVAAVLADTDLHTVQQEWGVDDRDGHGTEMAGVVMAGNLVEPMESVDSIPIGHRLESVKLLPKGGANSDDAVLHGHLTGEAVSRPESGEPGRRRIFNMAITAKDNRDRGEPSAWSAAIDRLAAGEEEREERKASRLFVISAGNVEGSDAWGDYPASNETDGIHDPGQSWNALTVGAMTRLVRIMEPDTSGYRPVAPAGGLSPFSTTSLIWKDRYPLKPDVVFEGGNAGKNELGAVEMTSLSLLTANARIDDRLLTTTNATSAASALAARMAAMLMAEYPDLWPETIRAIIVHSAEWTEEMRRAIFRDNRHPNKKDFTRLVRYCGFGEPNLERAMWSVENSLTMICEERLHPFMDEEGKKVVLRDMHLHRLPWPLEELERLGDVQVEMRVTLSYFIEPNPSIRGASGRYCYESHGLRYDVKRPSESERDFRRRINAFAPNDVASDGEDEEEGGAEEEETGTAEKGWTASAENDPNWVIGIQGRHRGSLHSDIWTGSAADLASRGVIGVYPASGWWRTRRRLNRFDSSARYALVVSIRAPETDVGLYSAVMDRVAALVNAET